ncbi:ABC transporter ATP-binding protein [Haloplasma contractile]|uniref:ABC transporter related protein n=1 Tax=Haloplasma contractile SSD-17B TaxID=1033810 RepID=U2FJW4_9MOLU|nr:ATP-binding cassette domain-containing protein [Haloplasma contractile]ERJ13110.1 ABC transporter related protein [Haloplasma contractile SSD-17B]
MIKIENMTFQYKQGQEVIKSLSFNLSRNEQVTLIGKSGCGKTTLLYLLAGIIKPTEGVMFINDNPLTGMRRKTGIVFQNGGLFPWKTVYNNLSIGLKGMGLKKQEIHERVEQVLHELNITHVADHYIKEISGGEKQRVAIGRVLVMESDLLLLDEPSSSLDAMTKETFQRTMLKLYDSHDLTSIIVTHDIEEAVYLGQKIVVMDEGVIKKVIDNTDLYGNQNARQSLSFYKRCIELRKELEII